RPLRHRPRAPRLVRGDLGDLEQTGGAHAAADAHGADDVAGAAALALDERVTHHPRAAHPVGVPDRDGAAVDVERVHGNAEAIAAVDDLDREGLVELPQADVVHRQAVALVPARHRDYGVDVL